MSRRATVIRERLQLLTELSAQLPRLRGRSRERTIRAVTQLEHELAPGRGAESEVLRQLDLEGDIR